MKRQESKDDKEKSDIPEALSQAVALYWTDISTLPFSYLLLTPCCAASCSETPPDRTSSSSSCCFLAFCSHQQTELNCCCQLQAKSCLPSHTNAPEAGGQVSIFQHGESSPTYPDSDRQPALQRCNPPLARNTHTQQAASAVKPTTLNK